MLPVSDKDLITAGFVLIAAVPCFLFGLNAPTIGIWIGAAGLVGLILFIGMAAIRWRRKRI